jgi:hypothetical protein
LDNLNPDKRCLAGGQMNITKPYCVLLKHLDKPECFLEDNLFREYIENCQNVGPISNTFTNKDYEAGKGKLLSVVKKSNPPPVQQAS